MIEAEKQLDEALEEVVDRRARGESVSMAEYEERYPHLAPSLSRHFSVLEALDRLVLKDGPPLPEETCVAGYRILRELGRGGMGVVFLAEQLSLQRLVALKLLSAPMARSYLAVERFKRESAITARLRHPNIVAVYDVGESQVYCYFAMEYVRGISIARLLAHLREMELPGLAEVDLRALVREMLPADEDWEEPDETPRRSPARALGYFGAVASIIADLADALAYAHSHGVLHRDVKPQNILLDCRLTPQLADFGVAKEVGMESLSVTGDLVGTPYYMSPELAMAGRIDIDHRTDIYSLGVTMFEMLTLTLPFSGTTSHEVLRRIVLEQPPSPRRVNPAVPRDLQVIALKAMEKDPDHRYQQASEMAEDLRRFLRFETIHARPPTALRLTGRWLKRYRIAVIAMLVLLFLTFLVAESVRRANVKGRIDTARSLEANEDWPAARDQYASILRELPDEPTAREGLERTERIIDKRWNDLVVAGKAHLEAEEYLPAVKALTEALALREDPDLRDQLNLACFVPVEISSDPPDATITIKRIHATTGKVLAGDVLRDISLNAGVACLPLGEYLVVVEKPEFGFGEYYLPVERDQGPRSLHATLRPTAVVIDGMAAIPGGRYRVGHDREGYPGTPPWLPQQEVEVESFYVDRTEVSNEQYLQFVQETGHPPPYTWGDGRFPEGEGKLPVVEISWDDARAYAEWAGKRLPTELEWEVAARGKEALLYSWGNAFDPSKANLAPFVPRLPPGKRVYVRHGGAVAVDSQTDDESPFGLLHTVGNVREWVWDRWVLPGQRWKSARLGVVKGRSWRVSANGLTCLCAHREPMLDGLTHHELLTTLRPRFNAFSPTDVGFRCAKSKKP